MKKGVQSLSSASLHWKGEERQEAHCVPSFCWPRASDCTRGVSVPCLRQEDDTNPPAPRSHCEAPTGCGTERALPALIAYCSLLSLLLVQTV